MSELRLHFPTHPEQARVVPHLRGFDPAGVVLLADVLARIAVMVEQRLALVRDRNDVRDRAVAESRDGALFDESLALERAQVCIRARFITARPLEIVREHRTKTCRSFEEIYFRSAKVIDVRPSSRTGSAIRT